MASNRQQQIVITYANDDEEEGSGTPSSELSLNSSLSTDSRSYTPRDDSLSIAEAKSYPPELIRQEFGISLTVVQPSTAPSKSQIKLQQFYGDLSQQLKSITCAPGDDTLGSYLSEIQPELTGINQLNGLFKKLAKINKSKLKDKDRIAIEEAKLAIMRIALFKMNAGIIEKQSSSLFSLKGVLVTLLLVLGLGFSGAETFTGAMDVFGGLFALSQPIAFGISMGLSLLGVALFVGLEANKYMTETGISSPFSITTMVQLSKQQLDCTVSLSKALRNPTDPFKHIDKLNDYRAFHRLQMTFQNDIKQKHLQLTNKNTWSRKAVSGGKKAFSFFGACLFACAGVIVGKDIIANLALLTFISITLSQPVALAIVIGLGVACFTLFWALQHRGVFDFFDAIAGRPKELLAEQETFINDMQNVNENVAKNIHAVEMEYKYNKLSTEVKKSKINLSSTLGKPLIIRSTVPNETSTSSLANHHATLFMNTPSQTSKRSSKTVSTSKLPKSFSWSGKLPENTEPLLNNERTATHEYKIVKY